jgi:hypothetical protein
MSLGQLVNSNAHTKWAGRPTTRTPHAARTPQSAAIHGHPRPSRAILAASLPRHPRAPYPPSRPVSPRGASHHPISPGQLVNSLRQHARNSPRAPDACLPGPRRERRPVGRPRPTGAPAPCGRPSCVQTFCGPKVIRGGRPPAHRVLATVSRGQLVNGPWDAHKGPDGLLALTPFEPSQRDLIPDPFLPSSAKSNGQLAYEVGRREGGRDPGSWPGVPSQSPLQPPGAAGPVSGGGV